MNPAQSRNEPGHCPPVRYQNPQTGDPFQRNLKATVIRLLIWLTLQSFHFVPSARQSIFDLPVAQPAQHIFHSYLLRGSSDILFADI
jgi:hypothetical protein